MLAAMGFSDSGDRQIIGGSGSLGWLIDKLVMVVVCDGVSVWLLGKCVAVGGEKRGTVASVLNLETSGV